MSNVVRSNIISVRIDPAMLRAVKKRARLNGRSMSSEILFLIRSQIEEAPARTSIKPISGWLSDIESPDNLDEFRKARAQASALLLESVRRKAKRYT
ncbi:MAG: Arc family DNA-binding protein [Polyangiaceae bacterium]|nr:Arc family DNA-binding protein [Polyangiaceae bacterium]